MVGDSHGEGDLGGGGAYGESIVLPTVSATPDMNLYNNPALVNLDGTLGDFQDGTMGDVGEGPAALGPVDTIPPDTSFDPSDLSSSQLDQIAAHYNNSPGARHHASSSSHVPRGHRGGSHRGAGRGRKPGSTRTNNAATLKKYPHKAKHITRHQTPKHTGARPARSHTGHPLHAHTAAPHPLDSSTLAGSSSREPAFHLPPLPLPGRVR